jgi:hypothetical protein
MKIAAWIGDSTVILKGAENAPREELMVLSDYARALDFQLSFLDSDKLMG